MSKRKHNQDDPFLSTMTFADMATCDCDECERLCQVPVTLVRDIPHDRMILHPMGASVTQERSLVKREGGISIWKTTMPHGAEPIREFGNSHRFIFVWSLPKNAKIQCIGDGVVGSSEEVRSRKNVHWREGSAFFLRSNGGKAIGWTSEINDVASNTITGNDERYNVVFYAIKATEDAIESSSDGGMFQRSLIRLFHKYLEKGQDHEVIESEDSALLKNLISENERDQD